MKKCPDCAEQVQDEARVCRYCGFRFDAVEASVPIVETYLLCPFGDRIDAQLPPLNVPDNGARVAGRCPHCEVEFEAYLGVNVERFVAYTGGYIWEPEQHRPVRIEWARNDTIQRARPGRINITFAPEHVPKPKKSRLTGDPPWHPPVVWITDPHARLEWAMFHMESFRKKYKRKK